MKALLLDGSRQVHPSFELVTRVLSRKLADLEVNLEVLQLRDLEIAPCQGCFGCWVKTPGKCLIADDAQKVTGLMVGSDLMVLLTPVTFGGYSSELKKALDRQICFISPFFTTIAGETHHRRRYSSAPKLLGIGVTKTCSQESESIFRSLVSRNALNLHAPAETACVISEGSSEQLIDQFLTTALENLEV